MIAVTRKRPFQPVSNAQTREPVSFFAPRAGTASRGVIHLLQRIHTMIREAPAWKPDVGAIKPGLMRSFAREIAGRTEHIQLKRPQASTANRPAAYGEMLNMPLVGGAASQSPKTTDSKMNIPGFWGPGTVIAPFRPADSKLAAAIGYESTTPAVQKTPAKPTAPKIAPRSRLYHRVEEVTPKNNPDNPLIPANPVEEAPAQVQPPSSPPSTAETPASDVRPGEGSVIQRAAQPPEPQQTAPRPSVSRSTTPPATTKEDESDYPPSPPSKGPPIEIKVARPPAHLRQPPSPPTKTSGGQKTGTDGQVNVDRGSLAPVVQRATAETEQPAAEPAGEVPAVPPLPTTPPETPEPSGASSKIDSAQTSPSVSIQRLPESSVHPAAAPSHPTPTVGAPHHPPVAAEMPPSSSSPVRHSTLHTTSAFQQTTEQPGESASPTPPALPFEVIEPSKDIQQPIQRMPEREFHPTESQETTIQGAPPSTPGISVPSKQPSPPPSVSAGDTVSADMPIRPAPAAPLVEPIQREIEPAAAEAPTPQSPQPPEQPHQDSRYTSSPAPAPTQPSLQRTAASKETSGSETTVPSLPPRVDQPRVEDLPPRQVPVSQPVPVQRAPLPPETESAEQVLPFVHPATPGSPPAQIIQRAVEARPTPAEEHPPTHQETLSPQVKRAAPPADQDESSPTSIIEPADLPVRRSATNTFQSEVLQSNTEPATAKPPAPPNPQPPEPPRQGGIHPIHPAPALVQPSLQREATPEAAPASERPTSPSFPTFPPAVPALPQAADQTRLVDQPHTQELPLVVNQRRAIDQASPVDQPQAIDQSQAIDLPLRQAPAFQPVPIQRSPEPRGNEPTTNASPLESPSIPGFHPPAEIAPTSQPTQQAGEAQPTPDAAPSPAPQEVRNPPAIRAILPADQVVTTSTTVFEAADVPVRQVSPGVPPTEAIQREPEQSASPSTEPPARPSPPEISVKPQPRTTPGFDALPVSETSVFESIQRQAESPDRSPEKSMERPPAPAAANEPIPLVLRPVRTVMPDAPSSISTRLPDEEPDTGTPSEGHQESPKQAGTTMPSPVEQPAVQSEPQAEPALRSTTQPVQPAPDLQLEPLDLTIRRIPSTTETIQQHTAPGEISSQPETATKQASQTTLTIPTSEPTLPPPSPALRSPLDTAPTPSPLTLRRKPLPKAFPPQPEAIAPSQPTGQALPLSSSAPGTDELKQPAAISPTSPKASTPESAALPSSRRVQTHPTIDQQPKQPIVPIPSAPIHQSQRILRKFETRASRQQAIHPQQSLPLNASGAALPLIHPRSAPVPGRPEPILANATSTNNPSQGYSGQVAPTPPPEQAGAIQRQRLVDITQEPLPVVHPAVMPQTAHEAIQRSAASPGEAEFTSPEPTPPPEPPEQPAPPNLADLARRVYPYVKRLLAIERERQAGR